MDIETKFNVGDVVCLDLGLVIEGGIRGVVVAINVEMAAIRQDITYTVSYDGKTITVPESMLSRMTYTVQEKTEEEKGKKKELTEDKLYRLLSKSWKIYWNKSFYKVFCVNGKDFTLHDNGRGTYSYTYEGFIEELKKSDFDITFYKVVKLEY